MAGLLPLLTETSLQAQVLVPLVTSLLFGLFSATLLVLVMVPTLYVILDDHGLTRAVEEGGTAAGRPSAAYPRPCLPIARYFSRRRARNTPRSLPARSLSAPSMASPTAAMLASRLRCAPPRGSGITSSMMPSFSRSWAVSLRASAASRA